MRAREGEAPAMRADALDQSRKIARLVVTVAQRARLVAELERAEEDHAPAGVGEDASHRPLRAVDPDEGEGRIRPRLDPAAEEGIGDIAKIARSPRAELDRA